MCAGPRCRAIVIRSAHALLFPSPSSRPRRRGLTANLLLGSLIACGLSAGCGGDAALSADVDVVLDSMGIPRLRRATSMRYASGYMMARMRLFQIEMVRRQAWGRQAELQGKIAFARDVASRALGFARYGIDTRHRMESGSARGRAPDASLCRGHQPPHRSRPPWRREPLPAEFAAGALDYQPERFTDDDPMSSASCCRSACRMRSTARSWRRCFAPWPRASQLPAEHAGATGLHHAVSLADHAAATTWDGGSAAWCLPHKNAAERARSFAYRPIAPVTGSNNWAVAGRHTDNGRPLLTRRSGISRCAAPAASSRSTFQRRAWRQPRRHRLRVCGNARRATRSQPSRRLDRDRQLRRCHGSVAREDRGRRRTRAGAAWRFDGAGTAPSREHPHPQRRRSPRSMTASAPPAKWRSAKAGEYGVFLPDEMRRWRASPRQFQRRILLRWTGQAATRGPHVPEPGPPA